VRRGEISKIPQVEQNGIGTRRDEALYLTLRIEGSRDGSQNQGMIEGNHQRTPVLPEDASQANGFPEIGQDFSPVKRYNTGVM
jgi:hypothetical protein